MEGKEEGKERRQWGGCQRRAHLPGRTGLPWGVCMRGGAKKRRTPFRFLSSAVPASIPPLEPSVGPSLKASLPRSLSEGPLSPSLSEGPLSLQCSGAPLAPLLSDAPCSVPVATEASGAPDAPQATGRCSASARKEPGRGSPREDSASHPGLSGAPPQGLWPLLSCAWDSVTCAGETAKPCTGTQT